VTAHPTRTDGVWRVMRFETKTGNYAELASNQVGPEAVPIPPGYQLVSVTPMVTAAEVEELREALVPFAFIGRASMAELGLGEEYDRARTLLGLEASA
jgi:hypothetical protein